MKQQNELHTKPQSACFVTIGTFGCNQSQISLKNELFPNLKQIVMKRVPFQTKETKILKLIIAIQMLIKLFYTQNNLSKIELEINDACKKILKNNPNLFPQNNILAKRKSPIVFRSHKTEGRANSDSHAPFAGRTNPLSMFIPTISGLVSLSAEDILYCQANREYTLLHLINGSLIVATRSLDEFEQKLASEHFFRVHDSYIVNLGKILKHVNGKVAYLIMQNNKRIDISSRKKEAFLKKWKN